MLRRISLLALVILIFPILTGYGRVMPIAPSSQAITPENINKLEEIARIGKGRINNAMLSPDGKIFAITTPAGIYLYETDTFTEIKHIQGNSIEFSPDNKYISIGSSLYDRETLEVVKTFNNQRINFSQDGKVINTIPFQSAAPATYKNDLGFLHSWDWEWFQTTALINDDGNKMVTSNGQTLNVREDSIIYPFKTFQLDFPLYPIRFLKDDQLVLMLGRGFPSNCDDPAVAFSVMNINNGKIILEKSNCIYWAPPIYIVTTDNSKLVLLYPEFADPERITSSGVYLAIIDLLNETYQEFHINPQKYNDWAEISPDGKILAIGEEDGVDIWRIGDAPIFDKTIQGIKWVNFSPNGSDFFALTSNGELEIRNSETFNILCRLDGAGKSASITYSADGEKALQWDFKYQELLLWDMDRCKVEQRMIWPSFTRKMSFSSNSKLLATPGGAFPWIYDMDHGQVLDTKPTDAPIGNVWSVAFLPNSNTLVVGGESKDPTSDKRGFLYTWDTGSEKKNSYTLLEGVVTSVQTTSDNTIVSKEFFDQNRIWDESLINSRSFGKGNILFNLKQNMVLSADKRGIWTFTFPGYKYVSVSVGQNPVALSPDGKFLIYATDDTTLSVKDIQKDRVIVTLDVPECAKENFYECQLDYHPSGTMIAVEAKESVIFFNTATGERLRTITKDGWFGVTFSPDGRWLASINQDGMISLWGIP